MLLRDLHKLLTVHGFAQNIHIFILQKVPWEMITLFLFSNI